MTIKNIGPIKNKVIFSLEKGKTEQYSENIIENTNLLKTIYIYGANNSGKSKLIECLRLLNDIALEGKELFQESKYLPFLPVEANKKSFEIEYEFYLNNLEYKYFLKIDPFEKNIQLERLTINDKVIFLREGNKVNLENFESEISKDIFFITYYYAKIGEKKEINNFFEYIKNIIYIDQQRDSHLSIRGKAFDKNENIDYLEEHLNSINPLIKEFGFDFEMEIIKENSITGIKKSIGVNKRGGTFPIHFLESFGTNVFIHLLLEIERQKDKVQLIIIDEIERGIHFALVAGFINYINKTYPTKQLILPTHMTDLLESDLNIRKDQIYISEITEEIGLKIERKFNKKVIRETMNFQKIFKSKSLGGVPEIKNFVTKV